MKLLIKNVKLTEWIMNEEKSELTPSQDFVFIGIRFCTHVGLMFPPPDMFVKILSRIRQLSALKFCKTREFLRPVELSGRPDSTWEVAPLTTSTSLTLKMETASGAPGSGSSLPESLL
jgi:hypothetical protein